MAMQPVEGGRYSADSSKPGNTFNLPFWCARRAHLAWDEDQINGRGARHAHAHGHDVRGGAALASRVPDPVQRRSDLVEDIRAMAQHIRRAGQY